jgi:hypothetical protein
VQPEQMREEGARPRNWGATHTHIASDAVTQQLHKFREQLKPMCTFFEGLAFVHE